ncbi:MAG: DUF4785 family protein [Legionella sp.]|nr:DUF4785 family protein [Legionella sp.]
MKSNYIVFLSALWVGHAAAMMLPGHELKSYECDTCESLSHSVLNTSWTIDSKPLGHDTLHHQDSVKYRQEVTLSELKQGVSIYTMAPGAVIRIVPLSRHIKAFTPEFNIKKGEVDLPLKDASALWAQDEALQNSPFINEILAVQLKPELGAGEFSLRVKNAGNNLNDRFMIHVLDKASNTALSLETDKAFYQYGDELVATLRLHDNATDYSLDTITISASTAAGETIPLVTEKVSPGVYKAHFKLDSEKNPHGKNWYVEAAVTATINEQMIRRHAHTAFSYAIPSAAITEIKAHESQPFSFTVNVNVATGSRYALQAVLFATGKKGKKEAIQSVQSAAWLAPGQSEMVISFPPDVANHYKAPYYLGSIQLIDYGQLKTVDTYNKPINISKSG